MNKQECSNLIKLIKGLYGNKFEVNDHTLASWMLAFTNIKFADVTKALQLYSEIEDNHFPPDATALMKILSKAVKQKKHRDNEFIPDSEFVKTYESRMRANGYHKKIIKCWDGKIVWQWTKHYSDKGTKFSDLGYTDKAQITVGQAIEDCAEVRQHPRPKPQIEEQEDELNVILKAYGHEYFNEHWNLKTPKDALAMASRISKDKDFHEKYKTWRADVARRVRNGSNLTRASEILSDLCSGMDQEEILF